MLEDHLILEIVDWAGLSFPLTYPVFLKPPAEYFERYYLYLKVAAFINQDGKCICKQPFYKPELHHAIVSRQDALGLENPDRIHHPHNVILLNPDCHKNIDRYESAKYLARIYGFENVVKTIKEIKPHYESFFFRDLSPQKLRSVNRRKTESSLQFPS